MTLLAALLALGIDGQSLVSMLALGVAAFAPVGVAHERALRVKCQARLVKVEDKLAHPDVAMRQMQHFLDHMSEVAHHHQQRAEEFERRAKAAEASLTEALERFDAEHQRVLRLLDAGIA